MTALFAEHVEYTVCGEADGLPAAMKLVHELRPHVVLVELSLHHGSGLELIKELSAVDHAVRICVFSMHDEFLFAERASGPVLTAISAKALRCRRFSKPSIAFSTTGSISAIL